MTNFEVIENKISAVKKYLVILEGYKKYSLEDISNDIDIKGAVERYLYLVCQAAIDLAEAVVSYKNLRKPTTMSEIFHILNEENIISRTLMEQMIGMVGFRNVVSHDYDKINYGIVYDVLHKGLENIRDFIKVVADVQ